MNCHKTQIYNQITLKFDKFEKGYMVHLDTKLGKNMRQIIHEITQYIYMLSCLNGQPKMCADSQSIEPQLFRDLIEIIMNGS